jgi:hypothetical protein
MAKSPVIELADRMKRLMDAVKPEQAADAAS